MKKNKPVVVTLVHGTWAKNAKWALEGQPLSDALSKIDGIRIQRLNWGGWNRYTTRKKAVQDLIDILKKSDANHFIIAHSHGGNIAISSIAKNESIVKGIICLNTPFFTVLARDLVFMVSSLAQFFLIALLSLSSILFSFYNWHWSIFLAPISIFGLIYVERITNRFTPKLIKYSVSLRKRIELPQLNHTPILCITTSEDEAYGWLGFLESLSNLPRLFIVNWFFYILMAVPLFFALVANNIDVLPSHWSIWFLDGTLPLGSRSQLVGYMLLISAFYSSVLYVVIFLVSILFSFIFQSIVQGTWMLPLSSLLFRTTISLVPVRSRANEFYEYATRINTFKDTPLERFIFFLLSGSKHRDLPVLQHSKLYSNPRIIERIVKWIEKNRST